jgi:NitT/TauT family transport system substrate-binding protein
MRARIVRMTRAIIDAAAAVREDPSQAQALVVASAGYTAREVADAWKHHAFPTAILEDTLDVLVAQEQWYASRDGRTARTRSELARLIDTSVYQEALAMGPQPRVR